MLNYAYMMSLGKAQVCYLLILCKLRIFNQSLKKIFFTQSNRLQDCYYVRCLYLIEGRGDYEDKLRMTKEDFAVFRSLIKKDMPDIPIEEV